MTCLKSEQLQKNRHRSVSGFRPTSSWSTKSVLSSPNQKDVNISVDQDNTQPTDTVNDSGIVDMTPEIQIPSGIGLGLLIVIGVGGNALTISAYCLDKKLRNVYHFFILHLAITDILLCTFSMPFYAVYTLNKFKWTFGLVFCKIWMVIDFTCCFESILVMLILSIDRLVMILLGAQYFQKVTMKIARIVIVISWIVSFLVYGPCIIGWDYWVGYSTIAPGDCDVEFAYDDAYTTATAFIEFVLPFLFMTSINAVIYYKIRERKLGKTKKKIKANATNTCPTTAMNTEDIDKKKEVIHTNKHINRTTLRGRGTKAAQLLAFLVVVFLVCWTPYTITTVMIAFCDDCVDLSLYEFFNWVVWMKSAVNPFLYAYNSVQYRANFRRLLTFRRHLAYVPTSDVSDSNTTSHI